MRKFGRLVAVDENLDGVVQEFAGSHIVRKRSVRIERGIVGLCGAITVRRSRVIVPHDRLCFTIGEDTRPVLRAISACIHPLVHSKVLRERCDWHVRNEKLHVLWCSKRCKRALLPNHLTDVMTGEAHPPLQFPPSEAPTHPPPPTWVPQDPTHCQLVVFF